MGGNIGILYSCEVQKSVSGSESHFLGTTLRLSIGGLLVMSSPVKNRRKTANHENCLQLSNIFCTKINSEILLWANFKTLESNSGSDSRPNS